MTGLLDPAEDAAMQHRCLARRCEARRDHRGAELPYIPTGVPDNHRWSFSRSPTDVIQRQCGPEQHCNIMHAMSAFRKEQAMADLGRA